MQVDINKYKKGYDWQRDLFKDDFLIHGDKLRHSVAQQILENELTQRDIIFLEWLGYSIFSELDAKRINIKFPDFPPKIGNNFYTYRAFWPLNKNNYDILYFRDKEKELEKYCEPAIIKKGKSIVKLHLVTPGLFMGLDIPEIIRFKSRKAEREFIQIAMDVIDKKKIISQREFAEHFIKKTNTKKRKIESVIKSYKRNKSIK